MLSSSLDHGKPVILISSARRAEEIKKELLVHLRALELDNAAVVWSDADITVGQRWFDEIATMLRSCHVAILLISADYLTSEFLQKEEVPVLLERSQREGLLIVPILISPCSWQTVAFG